MRYTWILFVALLSCAPEPEGELLSAPSPAATDRGCDFGWTRDGDFCARWRAAAPYPAAACGTAVSEAAVGIYGGPMLRCGDRGFVYDVYGDAWYPAEPGTSPPESWADLLPPVDPGRSLRRSAPLWLDGSALVVDARPDDHRPVWRARRFVQHPGSWQDTPDLPAGLNHDVLLGLDLGTAIAAGGEASAIYELRPVE